MASLDANAVNWQSGHNVCDGARLADAPALLTVRQLTQPYIVLGTISTQMTPQGKPSAEQLHWM